MNFKQLSRIHNLELYTSLDKQLFDDWLFLIKQGCELRMFPDGFYYPRRLRVVLFRPHRHRIIGLVGKTSVKKELAAFLADMRRDHFIFS